MHSSPTVFPRTIILISVCALILGAQAILAHAQATDLKFLITWRTDTYVPPGFLGKALPTANARIFASVEAIRDGRIVNLSNETIYWYIDGEFLNGGKGVQSVDFRAPRFVRTSIDLRVHLPELAEEAIHTISIPVVAPEAVIEAPFPGGAFSQNQVEVIGRPYFFNIKIPGDLLFIWNLSGRPPETSEDPEHLRIAIPAEMQTGSNLAVSLQLRNTRNSSEQAFGSVVLQYKK